MKWFVLIFFISITACKQGAIATPDVDYSNIQPINQDSSVNILIEIPAGTTAKYELSKATHKLEIDIRNGKPRYINYLGYPGNYGMIPNTLLNIKDGGDGDPLDVILLGESIERGKVVPVQIIGVLKLLDNDEQDDKIVAVPINSIWSRIKEIDELDIIYPGVKTIIAVFFENYKGHGEMDIRGWGTKKEAWDIISKAAI